MTDRVKLVDLTVGLVEHCYKSMGALWRNGKFLPAIVRSSPYAHAPQPCVFLFPSAEWNEVRHGLKDALV